MTSIDTDEIRKYIKFVIKIIILSNLMVFKVQLHNLLETYGRRTSAYRELNVKSGRYNRNLIKLKDTSRFDFIVYKRGLSFH